jgi:cytochrome c oxidase subunit 2
VSRRAIYLRRALVATLLLSTLLIFSSCSSVIGGAQNTLAPAGTVADRQRNLFLLVVWPATAIFILVEGLILLIVFRFRHRRGDDTLPRQVHGNPGLEVAWTVAPAILLAIIAVPTLTGIVVLGRAASADAVKVQVTGSQWIWQFSYPDYKDASGQPISGDTITDPNGESVPVMYIPVNKEIALAFDSTDVIHSFWVPKLAGKTDVIPNHPNHMWIKATELSDNFGFSGQCAEFCGQGHAQMRFRVMVVSQEKFDEWVKSKEGPAATATPATSATAAASPTAAATPGAAATTSAVAPATTTSATTTSATETSATQAPATEAAATPTP